MMLVAKGPRKIALGSSGDIQIAVIRADVVAQVLGADTISPIQCAASISRSMYLKSSTAETPSSTPVGDKAPLMTMMPAQAP